MAENTEHTPNPSAVPMHLDVRARFAGWQVMLATALGGIAIVAGIVLGLVLSND